MSAYDSATVSAYPYVAVHLHSARVTVDGGVIINVAALDKSTWTDWASYHGVEIFDGEAILYKAVDDGFCSGRGFAYPIGERVEAPDWEPGDWCGHGLHFSPAPHHAQRYFLEATRFLKVAIRLDEISIIDGNSTSTPKLKAKGCRVLAEVNIHGVELVAAK